MKQIKLRRLAQSPRAENEENDFTPFAIGIQDVRVLGSSALNLVADRALTCGGQLLT